MTYTRLSRLFFLFSELTVALGAGPWLPFKQISGLRQTSGQVLSKVLSKKAENENGLCSMNAQAIVF